MWHVGKLSTAAVMLVWAGLPLRGQTAAPETKTSIPVLQQQVAQHLQEQKPQLAIPVLRQIVGLAPKDVNAQANLGVLLHFQGQYAEAIPHLQAAVDLQGDLWRIHALLGMAEKRTGKAGEALPHLEQAFSNLEKEKIAIQVGLELIEIHAAAAQFEKALAVATRLGQLAPGEPNVLLATYQLARQTMDQAILNMALAAPESAEMHMLQASEFDREGNSAKAVGEYREAIKLNPGLPGVHFQLAEVMRTSADPGLNAQAQGEFEAAVKANPFDALAWRQLAGILTAKGDFKGAEEGYKKALAIQPGDADAKTGLAIVFISAGRQDEAMPLLESAVKDDPTNMTAHFRLSGLYRRAGRADDATREMDAFKHYQELKDKLGKVVVRRSSAGVQ